MKSIPELINLLDDEIRTRQKLINDMVGSLYPSILNSEITKLQRAIEELYRQ